VDNFVENGVEVAIVIEKDATEQLFLAFTYSPIYEGYHLYSKDLPEKGINGVGRPTSFEVISPHIFVKSTVIYESIPATTLYIEGFEKPFLVYPEGDVTLRVPITLRRVSEDQIRGDIYVTYMACDNAGTCLAPVVGKNLKMEIPHW
jgi:hypothetical protein